MTLPPILGTTYTRPLEREFEAWIVRQIEDYFLEIGRRVLVWAVSPTIEKTWPADEALAVSGKLIGLQFKQAQLASPQEKFDRLKWSLRAPAGQYELVQSRSEIFYALPTFINRIWARNSLNHCLFWRPPQSLVDYNAWYDNPSAMTPHRTLVRDISALRWGALVEGIVRCELGLRFEASFSVYQYLAELRAKLNRESGATVVQRDDDGPPSSQLFLIAVPFA